MQARRTDRTKAVRARYTRKFKQEAVSLVTGGQSIAAAARSLGVVEQTLFNWVKAAFEDPSVPPRPRMWRVVDPARKDEVV